MSFILGVRAALFALVHGVTLSLQLRKIYHLLSTLPLLYFIMGYCYFYHQQIQRNFFIKNYKFYLKRLKNIKF